jgi:hypothetical protein
MSAKCIYMQRQCPNIPWKLLPSLTISPYGFVLSDEINNQKFSLFSITLRYQLTNSLNKLVFNSVKYTFYKTYLQFCNVHRVLLCNKTDRSTFEVSYTGYKGWLNKTNTTLHILSYLPLVYLSIIWGSWCWVEIEIKYRFWIRAIVLYLSGTANTPFVILPPCPNKLHVAHISKW